MNNSDLSELTRNLHYNFKDIAFLEEALRHRSYVNEQNVGINDNERFEFLGDAVLSLVIGSLLMLRHPEFKEGDLSMLRADLVNETQLAGIARALDIGSYVQLGKGELQTGGMDKSSILADTYEAIIAAVYLDGGYYAAYRMLEYHFASLFDSISLHSTKYHSKSQLQELAQSKRHLTPIYKVINESGPDHDKSFTVQLRVGSLSTLGAGKSKKLAEQDAAGKALELIAKEDPEDA
jgi:ribonuclease III